MILFVSLCASELRSNVWASFSVEVLKGRRGVGCPPVPRLLVKVYADLNTFCKALVPQSE